MPVMRAAEGDPQRVKRGPDRGRLPNNGPGLLPLAPPLNLPPIRKHVALLKAEIGIVSWTALGVPFGQT